MSSDNRPFEYPSSQAGWWWVFVLTAVVGLVLYFTLPTSHLPRLLATTLPTLFAAFCGAVFAGVVSLRVRVVSLAAAAACGVLAFLFMPTSRGVSYWEAQRRLEELQACEGRLDKALKAADGPEAIQKALAEGAAEFGERLTACREAAACFTKLRSPMSKAQLSWGQRALKPADRAVQLAHEGRADEATALMTQIERVFAALGPWNVIEQVVSPSPTGDPSDLRIDVKLRLWRRLVSQTIHVRALEALPGDRLDEFKALHAKSDALDFHAYEFDELRHELRRRLFAATSAWSNRAVDAATKTTAALAAADKLTEAVETLDRTQKVLALFALTNDDINQTLQKSAEGAASVVMDNRLATLHAVALGETDEFVKRRKPCREVVEVFPGRSRLLDKAQDDWLEKSAEKAARDAQDLLEKGQLDEAEKHLKTARHKLEKIGTLPEKAADESFRAGLHHVLRLRLKGAAAELLKLKEAGNHADAEKLARRSADAWQAEAKAVGASAELADFVARCVGVALTDNCRAVDDFLAKGDAAMADQRLKRISREREDLLKLPGTDRAIKEYEARRRLVAEANLDLARKELTKSDAKIAEIALRARMLRDDWAEETKSLGMGPALWKMLEASADQCVRAAVAHIDADLKSKDVEAAFVRLQTVEREWDFVLRNDFKKTGPWASGDLLVAAQKRVAAATLTDARIRLVTLVDAEDYGAVEKLMQRLAAKRKELAAWGAGAATQAFLEGCELLLAVARSDGKLPGPVKK